MPAVDPLDVKILELMAGNAPNQEIATKLRKPLSTIQRRTRRLLKSGVISTTNIIDYRLFGYKTGLLHVYLNDGDAREVAEQVMKMPEIMHVSVHIGNSDIIAKYAVKNNQTLLEILSNIKKITNVNKIVWSEEVYALPAPGKVLDLAVTD
jgi:DNA-binding Lrp family transcriptional regulator